MRICRRTIETMYILLGHREDFRDINQSGRSDYLGNSPLTLYDFAKKWHVIVDEWKFICFTHLSNFIINHLKH